MAFPKFGPRTFRAAALGLSALAVAAMPLASGPSQAGDGQNMPTTAATSISSSMTVPTEEDLNATRAPARESLPADTGATRFSQAANTPRVADGNSQQGTGLTPAASVTEQDYPVLGPLEVMNYSTGRVVLYTGRDVQNIRGIMNYLNEVGRPTMIVYPNDEPGPLRIEPHQFAVFANGKFGGIYTQKSVNHGIGAEIEIFARNSGVPLRQAALTDDATLTAGL